MRHFIRFEVLLELKVFIRSVLYVFMEIPVYIKNKIHYMIVLNKINVVGDSVGMNEGRIHKNKYFHQKTC